MEGEVSWGSTLNGGGWSEHLHGGRGWLGEHHGGRGQSGALFTGGEDGRSTIRLGEDSREHPQGEEDGRGAPRGEEDSQGSTLSGERTVGSLSGDDAGTEAAWAHARMPRAPAVGAGDPSLKPREEHISGATQGGPRTGVT